MTKKHIAGQWNGNGCKRCTLVTTTDAPLCWRGISKLRPAQTLSTFAACLSSYSPCGALCPPHPTSYAPPSSSSSSSSTFLALTPLASADLGLAPSSTLPVSLSVSIPYLLLLHLSKIKTSLVLNTSIRSFMHQAVPTSIGFEKWWRFSSWF